MIIRTETGNIMEGRETRIAFAVNAEGINEAGFAGWVGLFYWPELQSIGETKLGSVKRKEINGIEFFALCCHSLKNGWINQKKVITQCFDAIPGDEPIATVSIGRGRVGQKTGANFELIRAGMEASKKKIILYE